MGGKNVFHHTTFFMVLLDTEAGQGLIAGGLGGAGPIFFSFSKRFQPIPMADIVPSSSKRFQPIPMADIVPSSSNTSELVS
jgi:hypothetical protein